MPPEWAPHLACYLAWPHNLDTWPGKFEVIPPIYAEMVAKIARFEPVRLTVTDAAQIDEVRLMILDAARRTEKEAPGALLPIDIPPPETRGNEPRLRLGKRGADATFGLKEPRAPTLCG